MERQNIHHQIEQFIYDFNRTVYHPILKRDIGQPVLNEHILFFLLLPKLNGEGWPARTNLAAIAVGAVYKAFDAHDDVDIYNVTTTEQQLKVLAGDFLSGIYYQLIASTSNFDFIHKMSLTIGRINELKTEFHVNPNLNKQSYLKTIQRIQTDCTVQFFQSFGFERYIPLVKVALPLTMILQSRKDKKKLSNDWLYNHQHAGEITDHFASKMEEELGRAKFLSPSLLKEIEKMTLPLLDKKI